MLLSEGAFAAGMIFSFLKLVHIFSINPHLGPLQVSLGRMIIDIIKFFFIYSLVLFAFGCGNLKLNLKKILFTLKVLCSIFQFRNESIDVVLCRFGKKQMLSFS